MLLLQIPISNKLLQEVLIVQGIDEGRVGNYIRIEDRINNIRYHVTEQVMTLVDAEVRKMQGRKTLTY